MEYPDYVRNVLEALLPTLERNYTYYAGILKGIRKISDVKGLDVGLEMFITEKGKKIDKNMRESLVYEVLPIIRPFSGIIHQEEKPDLISYLLAVANLLLGKEVNLNEREFARITKRVILELSGYIEEYYRQILMKTFSDDEKQEMVRRINRLGIYGKQNLVLKRLGVRNLFKEMKIEKTPYYTDYEKFVEDRNLVHSTEKPMLDTDLNLLIKNIETDVNRQIEELKTIFKPVMKRFVKNVLPVTVVVFYYSYFRIVFFLVIIDHCYDCWLKIQPKE